MHRFSFNLLPEKPKELIEKEEQRESVSLYFAFLPLIAIVLAIGAMIFNEMIVANRVQVWKNSESERDVQIESYRQVVLDKYEFVEKSNLLLDQVEKDVAPERFFELTDQLLSQYPFDVSIEGYGRNPDGSFDLELAVTDLNNVGSVIKAFEEVPTVVVPNADKIVSSEVENNIVITVNFFLIDEDLVQEEL